MLVPINAQGFQTSIAPFGLKLCGFVLLLLIKTNSISGTAWKIPPPPTNPQMSAHTLVFMSKYEHTNHPPPLFFYSDSWPLLIMTLRMSQTFPRYCAFVSLPPLLAWPLTYSWLLPSCFLFSMIKKPGQQQRRDRSLRMPKADNQRALLHPHLSRGALCTSGRSESDERLLLEVTFQMLCNSVYFAKHPTLPFWLSVFANIGPFCPVLSGGERLEGKANSRFAKTCGLSALKLFGISATKKINKTNK